MRNPKVPNLRSGLPPEQQEIWDRMAIEKSPVRGFIATRLLKPKILSLYDAIYNNTESDAEHMASFDSRNYVSTHMSHGDYVLQGTLIHDLGLPIPKILGRERLLEKMKTSPSRKDRIIAPAMGHFLVKFPNEESHRNIATLQKYLTHLHLDDDDLLMYSAGLSINGIKPFEAMLIAPSLAAQRISDKHGLGKDIAVVPTLSVPEVIPDYTFYGDKSLREKDADSARWGLIFDHAKSGFKGDLTTYYGAPISMKKLLSEYPGATDKELRNLRGMVQEMAWGRVMGNFPLQSTNILAYALLDLIFKGSQAQHYDHLFSLLPESSSDKFDTGQVHSEILSGRHDIPKQEIYRAIANVLQTAKEYHIPLAKNIEGQTAETIAERALKLFNQSKKRVIFNENGILVPGQTHDGTEAAFLMYASVANQIINYHKMKPSRT